MIRFLVVSALVGAARAGGFGFASATAAASVYNAATPFACPQPVFSITSNNTHVVTLATVYSARKTDAGAVSGRTPFAYVTTGPRQASFSPALRSGKSLTKKLGAPGTPQSEPNFLVKLFAKLFACGKSFTKKNGFPLRGSRAPSFLVKLLPERSVFG